MADILTVDPDPCRITNAGEVKIDMLFGQFLGNFMRDAVPRKSFVIRQALVNPPFPTVGADAGPLMVIKFWVKPLLIDTGIFRIDLELPPGVGHARLGQVKPNDARCKWSQLRQ